MDEYDKPPVEQSHDGYWQAIPPKLRYMGEMQYKALHIERRVRYSWQVRKFVWAHSRPVCIAKIYQANSDIVPLCLIWRLWIEIGACASV